MKLSIVKYTFFGFLLLYFFIINSITIADDAINKHYSPNINFSITGNKQRNITEVDLLLPLLQYTNSLILSDIKIKCDDRKSSEYNLGLAYRRNFSDKIIFGIYNYFDRRVTSNDLYVNQWTAGAEILSKYLDGRFNLYISQNKKKIIKPSSIEFVRDKIKVYALKKGAIEERALSGYDVEFGLPVFALIPKLNEKFATKFFVTRYYFQKKGIVKNIGTRFRLEQPIYNSYFNKRNSEINLFASTNKTNKEKWNYSGGLSLRMAIGKNSSNFTKTGLKKRMMDNIVRDVDIVTSQYLVNTEFVPIFWGNKKVNNIYFVGVTDDEDYVGDGSYEKPFTEKQFKKLKKDKDLVLREDDLIQPIMLDKTLDEDECYDLISECECSFQDQQIPLTHLRAESTSFDIDQYFPEIYKSKKLNSNLNTKIVSNKVVVKNDSSLISDHYMYPHVTTDKYSEKSSDYNSSHNLVSLIVACDENNNDNDSQPKPEVLENKQPKIIEKNFSPRGKLLYQKFYGVIDRDRAVKLLKRINKMPREKLVNTNGLELTPIGKAIFNAAINIKDEDKIIKLIDKIKSLPLEKYINSQTSDLTPKGSKFCNKFSSPDCYLTPLVENKRSASLAAPIAFPDFD